MTPQSCETCWDQEAERTGDHPRRALNHLGELLITYVTLSLVLVSILNCLGHAQKLDRAEGEACGAVPGPLQTVEREVGRGG